MLPDAARHEPPEGVDGVRVCAGVVEHHHRAVLDVVQPPLGRDEFVLTKLGPDRPVVAVCGHRVVIRDLGVHTEVLRQVVLGQLLALPHRLEAGGEEGSGGVVAGEVEGRVQPVHCQVAVAVITVDVGLAHLHLVPHVARELRGASLSAQ